MTGESRAKQKATKQAKARKTTEAAADVAARNAAFAAGTVANDAKVKADDNAEKIATNTTTIANLGGRGTKVVTDIIKGNSILSDRHHSRGVVFDLSLYNTFYVQVGTSADNFDGRSASAITNGDDMGRRDWINLVGAKDGQRFTIILIGDNTATNYENALAPHWKFSTASTGLLDRIYMRFDNSGSNWDADGIPISPTNADGSVYYHDMRLKKQDPIKRTHYKFRVFKDMNGDFLCKH
jgi:hypothetical protein